MAEGSFLRWPLDHRGDARALDAVAGDVPPCGAKRMVASIAPFEVAIYSPEAPVMPIDGAMHYALDPVSDTGPSSERASVIMLVAFDVPPALEAEVDRWYAEEHIGLLMQADGWLRARRFRVTSQKGGPRWTSLAFHELRDVSVMDAPERAIARSTPWRAELEKGDWFRSAGRGVFELLP